MDVRTGVPDGPQINMLRRRAVPDESSGTSCRRSTSAAARRHGRAGERPLRRPHFALRSRQRADHRSAHRHAEERDRSGAVRRGQRAGDRERAGRLGGAAGGPPSCSRPAATGSPGFCAASAARRARWRSDGGRSAGRGARRGVGRAADRRGRPRPARDLAHRAGGAALTDETYVAASFTPEGVGLRPFSVVHVEQPWRKAREPGDLVIRWTRRSRALAADSWTATEVPLAEESEAYEVEILDGAVVKRRLDARPRPASPTPPPSRPPTGARCSGRATALDVRIFQLSALVGRGAGQVTTLTF